MRAESCSRMLCLLRSLPAALGYCTDAAAMEGLYGENSFSEDAGMSDTHGKLSGALAWSRKSQ